MVEDDPDDRMLILNILQAQRVTLELVPDGTAALDYLFGSQKALRLPQLVVLDLVLPKKPGLEILKEIRAHPATGHLPVVILTNACEPEKIMQAYRYGANSFICKPSNFSDFKLKLDKILSYWLSVNEYHPATPS